MATIRPKARYRPVLSAEEVSFIASQLKRVYAENLTKHPYHPDQPNDPNRGMSLVQENLNISVMQKFSVLEAKIKAGSITPDYVTKGSTRKEDVLLDLGGEIPSTTTDITPDQRRLVAWSKYIQDLDSCTPTEIADAMEHRFQHGLMTPKEAEQYEAKMWEIAASKVGDK